MTAASGYEETVAILLQNNPNIQARNKHEKIAQYCAVFSRHKSRVKLLLRKGANIETDHTIFRAAIFSQNAVMISYTNAMTDKETKVDDVRSSVSLFSAKNGDDNVGILAFDPLCMYISGNIHLLSLSQNLV